jgi:hypothetical protein
VAIKHTAVVATPDDGTSDVGSDEWNADHSIDNDTITYAKIQNVTATDKLLGRVSSGAGDIEEISCTAAGRDLIDDADATAQRTTLGLAAVAASGSASDLGTGTLPIARIADAAVTYAKIQNVSATQRVLGRNTAGAGVTEEVTASQLLDWASSTNGVLLTRASGTWGALANVTTNDGNVELAHDAAPATPAAGKTGIHGLALAARGYAAFVNSDGRQHAVQPMLGRCHIGHWLPPGANAAPLALGITAPTVSGTATSRNPSLTNLFTQTRRIAYISASSAGSVAGLRNTTAQFWRGNAAGLGGFFATFRWGNADSVTTCNQFCGMQSIVTAPTDVAPSTLTNLVGVGSDSGDTNMQLYASDGTARARVDLGASFPANSNATAFYELILYCPPNASAIDWALTRLDTGVATSGQITGTNLPVATQFLNQQIYRTNGATAASVELNFMSHYIETEY